MRFVCWLLRFGRKKGDDGKNVDKGLADWGLLFAVINLFKVAKDEGVKSGESVGYNQ